MDAEFIIEGLFATLLISIYIGSRFNSWPIHLREKPSGFPKDYTDTSSYRTWQCMYILVHLTAFSILWMIAKQSLELLPTEIQIDQNILKFINALFPESTSKLAISAVYFTLAISTVFFSKYDEKLRSNLQTRARIPRAVIELKKALQHNIKLIEPDLSTSQAMRDAPAMSNDMSYWSGKIEEWRCGAKRQGIVARYLNCVYAFYICKDRDLFVTKDDEKRNGDELDYLAIRVKNIDTGGVRGSEETDQCVKSIEQIFDDMLDLICKKAAKEGKAKTKVLRRMGFRVPDQLSLSSNIEFLKAAFSSCVVGVLFSFLLLFIYLQIMDTLAVHFPAGNGIWYSPDRLIKWWAISSWAVGSGILVCTVAYFFEDSWSSSAREYELIRIVFAVSFALAFLGFHYINPGTLTLERFFGRVMLSFSTATISWFTIKAIVFPDIASANTVKRSAFVSACLAGLLSGLFFSYGFAIFQVRDGVIVKVVAYLVQGSDSSGVIVAFFYAFLRAFVITFVFSYFIQEVLRRKKLRSNERQPREDTPEMSGELLVNGNDRTTVRIWNISMGGALIDLSKGGLTADQEVVLKVFGMYELPSRIRWAHGRRVGVSFNEDAEVLKLVRGQLRLRYGEAFA